MTLIIGVIDCFVVFLRLLKINIDRLASFYQITAVTHGWSPRCFIIDSSACQQTTKPSTAQVENFLRNKKFIC